MIPLFDAHCDTLFELEHRRLPIGALAKNKLHTDLERFRAYAPAAQFFAIWGIEQIMPDCDIFNRLYSRFIAEAEENGELMSFCRSASDAEKAAEENKLAAFLAVEGAHLLNEESALKKHTKRVCVW